MKLPKRIELEGRTADVERALRGTERLWPKGQLEVPVVPLGRALRDVLESVHAAGQVTRGLERAEERLAAELRGMQRADRRSGATRGERVSRLLLVTDDCAERMARRVETVVARHAGRVLVVRLACGSDVLGPLLFGPDRPAKLLLLDHKEAVAEALLAIADGARTG